MKNKIIKIVLCVLIGIITLILVVFAAFSVGERIIFLDFYRNAERYEKVPGILDGYVAQGYTTVDGEDYRLACGYMANDRPSRIYVLKDGQAAVYAEMKKSDGSNYTGHTGGIDVYGEYVYITASTGCDLFLLDDVLDGDGIATKVDAVKTINDPAYCVIHDGMLYIGSFYHAGDYETPSEHRITTPAGDNNTAILSAYRLDPQTGKPTSDIPDYVYSTTSFAQGMTFTGDGRMIISTSYGLTKSHLYVYDLDSANVDPTGFDVDGTSVPLIYLDSECLLDDIISPPMAEEIIYDDGVVYIMNESASNKYHFGKLTSGTHVYGYKLD